MTKIPSVEEKVEEKFNGSNIFWKVILKHLTPETIAFIKNDYIEALTADRTALLTELRDSGLLKTKSEIVNMLQDDKVFIIHGMDGVKCHNTLVRAIKAHINNLINPK